MIWENFKNCFHESWWEKMQKFIESKECDEIYEFLKKESRRGVHLAPSSFNTYRAFLETPLDGIKAALIGYCPYHTFTKEGIPVADGLAFSCSVTGKQQPSLTKFVEGIEQDVYNGLNLNYNKNITDLTYLAREGILLLNSSLTVAKDKAGSHQELWHPFTKYILEECLAYTGVPIMFIGKDAAQYKRYVSPLTHGHIFEVEHPSFSARIQQPWETKEVFTKITRIVKENTGKEIDWLNECPPF